MPGFTLFDHMDVRLDPACAGWMSGRLVEKSEHKGWVRFKDDRPYDAVALTAHRRCVSAAGLCQSGVGRLGAHH